MKNRKCLTSHQRNYKALEQLPGISTKLKLRITKYVLLYFLDVLIYFVNTLKYFVELLLYLFNILRFFVDIRLYVNSVLLCFVEILIYFVPCLAIFFSLVFTYRFLSVCLHYSHVCGSNSVLKSTVKWNLYQTQLMNAPPDSVNEPSAKTQFHQTHS